MIDIKLIRKFGILDNPLGMLYNEASVILGLVQRNNFV